MIQLSLLEEPEEPDLKSFSRKVESSRATDVSPWTDWRIAREIEDDAFHFRVVAAYRKDRVRGLTDDQRDAIDAELDAQGYRNSNGRGKWPHGKTPDRMIAERIGVERYHPETGGAMITQDRELRVRYKRVTRYLLPFLNARVPSEIKRGRDTYDTGSVVGPMLVECVAWWKTQTGGWPGPGDFDGEDMPTVEFVERYTDGVEDLVHRAQAYFN